MVYGGNKVLEGGLSPLFGVVHAAEQKPLGVDLGFATQDVPTSATECASLPMA